MPIRAPSAVRSGGLVSASVAAASTSAVAQERTRCCQTNANSSQFIWLGSMLGSKETAPLGKSGGTVQLEIRSAVKGALLIEMIVH